MSMGFDKHELTLIEIVHECTDVYSFYFDYDRTAFKYKAGMAVNVLRSPDEDDEDSREFSMASSPSEEFLIFTMRISRPSSFKRWLSSLKPGDKVVVEGPYGHFILPDEAERPIVFLAGGIGVTPYRGLVKSAVDGSLPHRITLLYSVRTPEEILFAEVWDEAVRASPDFRLVQTVTRPEEAEGGWDGRTGRIDEALVREFAPDLTIPIFYLCGTPGMVQDLMALLVGMGLSPAELKMESFSGYSLQDV